MNPLNLVFGNKQQRDIQKLRPIVKKINELEEETMSLSNEELKDKTNLFIKEIQDGRELDDLLPQAFAVAKEAAYRSLHMKPFDVQLLGGIVLHKGNIAEMKTGEGKTLVATLPLYLNALTKKGVCLVTVNDYLAKRDALWMSSLYLFLGLSVGIINQDQKSYKVEWDNEEEFTTKAVACTRKESYACDITYATNNELGFDYLRDNMVHSFEQKSQRGHYFAIVDEADSILIDEARTPLIISGPSDQDISLYKEVNKIIPQLTRATIEEATDEIVQDSGDFAFFEKQKNIVITETGVKHIEQLLKVDQLYSPENSHLVHYVLAALKAHYMFHKDIDYVIENKEIVIIDEFTGRKMPGRRWSDGIHQAIEAKEHLPIKKEYQTLASVTFQNLFRMYDKLSGMTGTAATEATEFYTIYRTDVIVIPTNKPVIREDLPDKMFGNERAKFNHIVQEVIQIHEKGQPCLIGTISVENSEILSKMLKKERIPHNVLNAKYHEREAEIISKAGLKGSVTIATNMAGRGTDIKLGEGVADLGGLYVIGSERHESRRIDNQLRGRSGRQGDAGKTQFYVCLDDDLLRLFGEKTARFQMMKNMFKDEVIESKLLSSTIERAQKKIESRNFEIRKNLLEFDDVANEQRGYTYKLRDQILDIENNEAIVKQIISSTIDEFLSYQMPNYKKVQSWDMSILENFLRNQLHFTEDFTLKNESYDSNVEELTYLLYNYMNQNMLGEDGSIPAEIKLHAFRMVLLQILDQKWKNHLKALDSIRESIGLRGYAQKNPITEYKLESASIFHDMKTAFHLEVVSLLMSLRIKKNIVGKNEKKPAPFRIQAPQINKLK